MRDTYHLAIVMIINFILIEQVGLPHEETSETMLTALRERVYLFIFVYILFNGSVHVHPRLCCGHILPRHIDVFYFVLIF